MENEDLYEKILREKGICSRVSNNIYHQDEEKNFELTYQQKSIWFLQNMNPSSPMYNNPSAVLLKGRLDVDRLYKTFFKIIERHKILNVKFIVENGVPYQHIKKDIDFGFELLDYRDNINLVNEESVNQLVNKIVMKPFDILNDPMLKVTLIKLNTNEHIMIINIHHIVSDGWSKGIMLKELASIYEKLEGMDSGKLELPQFQYYDYVRWINGKLDSQDCNKQIGFWKQKLKNAPVLLELPTDFPRASIQSNKGSMLQFLFSKNETEEIENFCKVHNSTLFTFLLSALKVLIYRYSGEEDLVIGTPVAGRNISSLEGMIGLFVNTVTIRTLIDKNQTFNEYLNNVKNETYKAFSNQEVPFDLLVEKLNPKRELSYNPIFQVMFQLDNSPIPELKIGDLELKPMIVDMGISQLDLSVTCWKEGDLLKGTFEYNTQLFKKTTIERMLVHYRNIIKSVLKKPEEKISKVNYLLEDERERLIHRWNDTSVNIDDIPVVKMFENKAFKNPDNIAVIFNEQKVSYKHLNEKANLIQSYLINNKLNDSDFMAICMNGSIELISTVIAVLKCERAFVPIDPQYPINRIETIIDDLNKPVILTDKENAHLFLEYTGKIILVEDIFDNYNDQSNKPVYINDKVEYKDSVCCVIYTSGSTGKPKGVLIENHSVLNIVHSFIKCYEADENDKMMPITSISSASFVGEMMPILSAGGTLVLVDKEKYLDIEELINYIKENNVTILSTVPSMISRLNTIENLPKSVRLILSGGETLYPNQIDKLNEIKIVNGYGLTESGICSTYKVIDRDDLNGNDSISVGRPIMNNYIYILDGNLQPVPVGIKGEIFISGLGLAKEYYNNPEMTKERFINNPFVEGYKMFKTGDIGYWLENGELQFLGRADNQVQVHGYRVELNEIQIELLKHKNIKEVVVTTKKTEHDDNILIAYYTSSNGNKLNNSEVSEWLAMRKPRYMVPRSFVMVEKIPLNTNGKIDINKLSEIEYKNHILENNYEYARTETEKAIASIWMEYLEISQVGINDNFFDIGGHSLLASKVLSRLKETVCEKLTIVDLFKYPTISSLGKYIDNANNKILFKDAEERALKKKKAIIRRRERPVLNNKE